MVKPQKTAENSAKGTGSKATTGDGGLGCRVGVTPRTTPATEKSTGEGGSGGRAGDRPPQLTDPTKATQKQTADKPTTQGGTADSGATGDFPIIETGGTAGGGATGDNPIIETGGAARGGATGDYPII